MSKRARKLFFRFLFLGVLGFLAVAAYTSPRWIASILIREAEKRFTGKAKIARLEILPFGRIGIYGFTVSPQYGGAAAISAQSALLHYASLDDLIHGRFTSAVLTGPSVRLDALAQLQPKARASSKIPSASATQDSDSAASSSPSAPTLQDFLDYLPPEIHVREGKFAIEDSVLSARTLTVRVQQVPTSATLVTVDARIASPEADFSEEREALAEIRLHGTAFGNGARIDEALAKVGGVETARAKASMRDWRSFPTLQATVRFRDLETSEVLRRLLPDWQTLAGGHLRNGELAWAGVLNTGSDEASYELRGDFDWGGGLLVSPGGEVELRGAQEKIEFTAVLDKDWRARSVEFISTGDIAQARLGKRTFPGVSASAKLTVTPDKDSRQRLIANYEIGVGNASAMGPGLSLIRVDAKGSATYEAGESILEARISEGRIQLTPETGERAQLASSGSVRMNFSEPNDPANYFQGSIAGLGEGLEIRGRLATDAARSVTVEATRLSFAEVESFVGALGFDPPSLGSGQLAGSLRGKQIPGEFVSVEWDGRLKDFRPGWETQPNPMKPIAATTSGIARLNADSRVWEISELKIDAGDLGKADGAGEFGPAPGGDAMAFSGDLSSLNLERLAPLAGLSDYRVRGMANFNGRLESRRESGAVRAGAQGELHLMRFGLQNETKSALVEGLNGEAPVSIDWSDRGGLRALVMGGGAVVDRLQMAGAPFESLDLTFKKGAVTYVPRTSDSAGRVEIENFAFSHAAAVTCTLNGLVALKGDGADPALKFDFTAHDVERTLLSVAIPFDVAAKGSAAGSAIIGKSDNGVARVDVLMASEDLDLAFGGRTVVARNVRLDGAWRFSMLFGPEGLRLASSDLGLAAQALTAGGAEAHAVKASLQAAGSTVNWSVGKLELFGGAVEGIGRFDYAPESGAGWETRARISVERLDLAKLAEVYSPGKTRMEGLADGWFEFVFRDGELRNVLLDARGEPGAVKLDRATVLGLLKASGAKGLPGNLEKYLQDAFGQEKMIPFETARMVGSFVPAGQVGQGGQPAAKSDRFQGTIELQNKSVHLTVEPIVDSSLLPAYLALRQEAALAE